MISCKLLILAKVDLPWISGSGI